MKIIYFLNILLLIFFTNANSSELLKLKKPKQNLKCFIKYGPYEKFNYFYDIYENFVIEKRQQNTDSKYFKEYTYVISSKKNGNIFAELKSQFVEGVFNYILIDFNNSRMSGGFFRKLLNGEKLFDPSYSGNCLSLN